MIKVWIICLFILLIWLSRLVFFAGSDTLKEDLLEILFGLVFGVFIVLVLISDYTLQNLRTSYEMIKGEWRLLEALSKDFQQAYSSVEEIEGRAKLVWYSEELMLNELTQRLRKGEETWKKKTGDLSFEARRCTDKFEKVSERCNLLAFVRRMLTRRAFVRWMQKPDGIPRELDLLFGMRRTKGAIKKYRKDSGRECARKSVTLLEESRGRVRTLRDRPIDDANIDPTKQPLPSEVASVFERLVVTNPSMTRLTVGKIRFMVIQLNLLRALMTDLKGVRLESQMETVWLQVAQEILDQAHKVIGAFLQEAANQVRWLSSVTDYWRYGPKLKEVTEQICNLLEDLFEAKERYGFNFVVRGLSKDSISNLHHREDDGTSGAISSVVRDIRSKLLEHELERKKTPREVQSVASLLLDIQKLDKELKDQEKTDGAIQTRKACFTLLKKLVSDLNECLKNPRQDRIDHIKRDVKLLEKCSREYKIKVVDESCSVVGLKEDVHDLIFKLTGSSSPPVVSIVGMRGVGKTTLAKEICNHRSVVSHFTSRPFVTDIPETPDHVNLLKNVAEKIMKTQERTSEREYLINKLSSFLKEHRTLVVLDCPLSKDAWDSLKPALIPNGSISAVVLITRDKEVAFHANPDCVHRHRLRTAEESWEFFTQMVNIPDEPEVLQRRAKKVVERTGGLPLAILRLGYLLSERSVTEKELLSSYERISQGQNQTPWEDNLEPTRRYFQSQPEIKNCLSYFQLFPKDLEIPARRLIAVWVAQAVTSTHTIGRADRGSDQEKTEEHVAYGYLLDLIDQNIVQPVERKHNGKVLTCRFPSILKDIWLKGRHQEGTARSWSLYASSGQQFAYRFDHNEDGSDIRSIRSIRSNVLREEKHPLSVTFLDSREGGAPGEDVCNLIVQAMGSGSFGGLLVLDLELVFKPKLPDNIGKLKQLKYFGLRWTYLEVLPNSVGQLSELQTLDLKRTSLQSLPSSIWKLKKLQRLHLDHNFRIKDVPETSRIGMKNLQKLSGGFVDSEGKALLESLHKLTDLRTLKLSFQLTPEEQETLSKNILQLTNLQSLSLRSVNVSNESQDLKLTHLASLKKLSSLYLLGKIANMGIISELPRSLTDLTLSASEFLRGRLLLEVLAELPELKYLSFLSRSYVDSKLVFLKDGFPKLLVLKLWALNDLASLKVEEGAMPKIRELEIRECKSLRANNDLPTGLTQLKTLQELIFTNMHDCQEYVSFVQEEFDRAKTQSSKEILHLPALKKKTYNGSTLTCVVL